MIYPSAFYGCYKLVEVYNLSNCLIIAGELGQGYSGYYALNVYKSLDVKSKRVETTDGFVFYEDGDVCYLLEYKGDETDITLPESYNGKSYEINRYAFYNNDKLKSVTISAGVTSIGDSAFSDCTHLTSITISDGVTSIGYSAFKGCVSLTSIIIPGSITSISNSAFLECDSIANVYYSGNESDWRSIYIDYYNYNLASATRYYYSENEPTEDGKFWHYDTNGSIVVW